MAKSARVKLEPPAKSERGKLPQPIIDFLAGRPQLQKNRDLIAEAAKNAPRLTNSNRTRK